jgi:hypothetical protein
LWKARTRKVKAVEYRPIAGTAGLREREMRRCLRFLRVCWPGRVD